MESGKLKALAYADIFDYPLTESELHKWKLIDGIKSKALGIKRTDRYYYLKGRDKIIKLRKQRERISKTKLKIARKAVSLLKKIPTVKMIAITGGLAMANSQKNDDIDLLIVTNAGTLWLTRGLATLLLDFYKIRRRPREVKVKDKICLNMFVEESNLILPKNEQDLYGAHEVYQIKPLFSKNNTYERFLKANNWASKFLPNAITSIKHDVLSIKGKRNALEFIAKYLQLWYMKDHRTTEVVTDHMLRFHPKDYRELVLKKYKQVCKLRL